MASLLKVFGRVDLHLGLLPHTPVVTDVSLRASVLQDVYGALGLTCRSRLHPAQLKNSGVRYRHKAGTFARDGM